MQNRIRIESNEHVVSNAKILYLPDEGELFDKDGEPLAEVDISKCITGVDLHLHVGEVSRATLHTILVDGRVDVDVEEMVVRHLKRRLRFRRLHRWKSRLADGLKTWVARSLSQQIQREYAHRARQTRRTR
jgi:hypothetical protein